MNKKLIFFHLKHLMVIVCIMVMAGCALTVPFTGQYMDDDLVAKIMNHRIDRQELERHLSSPTLVDPATPTKVYYIGHNPSGHRRVVTIVFNDKGQILSASKRDD